MKKGLIMLLTLIIAGTIGLTGCQKKEKPATPPAGAPAPETQAPPVDEAPPTGEATPPAEQPAEAK